MSISVIIPAYNAENYLALAVQSVRDQTRLDWELIIVDDGSQDATGALADGFAADDSRIRVIHQANTGLSGARNSGLAATPAKASAERDYVLFLDADDVLEPEALTVLAALLDHAPAACAAYGLACFIDGKGRSILPGSAEEYGRSRKSVRSGRLITHPQTEATSFPMLVYRNPIQTPGQVLLRRAVLERAGLFDTALPPTADWDMWLRITRQGEMLLADRVVLKYRRHEHNMSGKEEVMRAAELTLRLKTYRDAGLTADQRRSALDGYRHSERGFAVQWRSLAGERLAKGHLILGAKMLYRASCFYLRSLSGLPLSQRN